MSCVLINQIQWMSGLTRPRLAPPSRVFWASHRKMPLAVFLGKLCQRVTDTVTLRSHASVTGGVAPILETENTGGEASWIQRR